VWPILKFPLVRIMTVAFGQSGASWLPGDWGVTGHLWVKWVTSRITNITVNSIVYYIYINIQVSYTSRNGFVSSLVTLNNSLQICKSIIRHATIQSRFVIVQFRKVFSFRKWLANTSNLTFWRRNYIFLILAHPVYKMWIIQEPNTLELWNKLHFEEKKTESIHHV